MEAENPADFLAEDKMSDEAVVAPKENMSLSLWLEMNNSEIDIKGSNGELNFCWRFIKQNNPDSSCVNNLSPESIALRTKKGQAVFACFKYLQGLQSIYTTTIDTIVLDENILNTRRTSHFILQKLKGIQCNTLVIRGTSIEANDVKSLAIQNILSNMTILDTHDVFKIIFFLFKLRNTPNASVIITGILYAGTIVGYNRKIYLKSCRPDVISNAVFYSLANLKLPHSTTLWLTIEKFEYKPSDKFFKEFGTHVTENGRGGFHDMSIEQQLEVLTTNGLDIRCYNGHLVTVFTREESPEKKTFIMHVEFPWERQVHVRVSSIMEQQAVYYQEYEKVLIEEQDWISAEKQRKEYLEETVDKHGEISRRDLLESEQHLQIKRLNAAEAIKKAKLEIRKYNLERKLENGAFLSMLVCTAPKRKEFGYLSDFFYNRILDPPSHNSSGSGTYTK
uniref:Recep_L_domain domain-containing protein n=1 Tax=Caenorhabditis tropicalis TaxID=1561998 RepID=A0A1I7TZ83_9PELO